MPGVSFMILFNDSLSSHAMGVAQTHVCLYCICIFLGLALHLRCVYIWSVNLVLKEIQYFASGFQSEHVSHFISWSPLLVVHDSTLPVCKQRVWPFHILFPPYIWLSMTSHCCVSDSLFPSQIINMANFLLLLGKSVLHCSMCLYCVSVSEATILWLVFILPAGRVT
jgi:hypothetical protein